MPGKSETGPCSGDVEIPQPGAGAAFEGREIAAEERGHCGGGEAKSVIVGVAAVAG